MKHRIRTPEGCKPIGKGAFTKAFLDGDGDVILLSACNAKECMALGWFPEHRLVPEIRRLDSGVYHMKHYPRKALMRNLNKQGQSDLRTLNKVFREFRSYWHTAQTVTDNLRESITREGAHLTDFLLECVDAMCNYSSEVGFEPSRRNLAADEHGNLVMLDAFFDAHQLSRPNTITPPTEWTGDKTL